MKMLYVIYPNDNTLGEYQHREPFTEPKCNIIINKNLKNNPFRLYTIVHELAHYAIDCIDYMLENIECKNVERHQPTYILRGLAKKRRLNIHKVHGWLDKLDNLIFYTDCPDFDHFADGWDYDPFSVYANYFNDD